MSDQAKTELWDYLIETGFATEEEIQLVIHINGYNLESLESILYARAGYQSLHQIQECEGC